jgi:hypothetical protein
MGHQRGRKGKRGTKKHGRNRVKCERYRCLGRREFNRARRIAAQKRREAKVRAKKAARAARMIA